MHLKKVFISFVAVIFASSAYAGLPNATNWEKQFKWIKSSHMPKLIKEAQKRHKTRKLASYNSIDTAAISDEYKSMVQSILSADSPEKIASLIKKLEKNIDQMPNDAKFLGTQILLLKPFRGLIYRMIPMVAKEKITHSFLRNQVKVIASNMRVYLPLNHWEAGFKYITEPYKINDKEVVSQFKDKYRRNIIGRKKDIKPAALQFQEFLGKEVYPAMAHAAKRIESLNFSAPIIWDNKVAFGTNSFKDDFEETRYRKIGEAERILALSSLHFGMHYLNYLVAYDIKGSLALSKDIGKLYGIDGFWRRSIEGVPSYKWTNIVRKKKYNNIGQLKDGFQGNMALSYSHLKQGVKHLRIAREELRNEPADRFFVIDASKVNIWDDNIEKQFKNIECLTSDQAAACPIRSAITGHTVVLNLQNFYKNPPRDLKSFLPTNWNTKNQTLKKHGKIYPNYNWGTPTQWNVGPYQTHVFPELKDQKEIPQYVRTLREAFGGEAFGVPLALFVE